MVMAAGIAQLQPDGSTIRTLHLTKLESLPSAAPKTLEQLAREQGIGPVQSLDDLAGEPIPPAEFEEFLAAMGRARECDE